MSNKEIVADLLQRLPENASLRDIAREIESVAAVHEGMTELDHGASFRIEEEEAWLRAVSGSEAFAFLADPAEDIYSATDGEPFRDAV